MKKCKNCQKEIDAKAKKCPFCQSDLRNWFVRHPIWTIVLVLFVIGMFGVASSGGNEKTASKSTPTTAQAEPTKAAALQVDALVFVTDFDKNQLNAEEKYKDKVVELTAVIKNISEDIGGAPFLSLEPVGNKMFGTSIKCVFKSKSELTSVENGNTVTVVGKVANQSLGIIQLDGCSLK